MSLGITSVLKTIADLQDLAIHGIDLAKAASGGPFALGAILAGVVKLAGDVKDLVADAPMALPEMADLDSAEVGKLGSASYDCVKAVLAALAA